MGAVRRSNIGPPVGSWQSDPRVFRLATGTWNNRSLVGKEPELVHEVEQHQLDKVSTQLGLWNESHGEGLDSVPLRGSRQWWIL